MKKKGAGCLSILPRVFSHLDESFLEFGQGDREVVVSERRPLGVREADARHDECRDLRTS